MLYVTSENYKVTIIDLSTFTKWGEMEILDADNVPARHIDWPVINPRTNRFYVSDEFRPDIFIYDLRDYVNPNLSKNKKK